MLDALFSSWGGLLFWSPLLWLGDRRAASMTRRRGRAGVLAAASSLLAVALGRRPAKAPIAARGSRPSSRSSGSASGARWTALRAHGDARARWPAHRGRASPCSRLWNLLFMEQYRDGGSPATTPSPSRAWRGTPPPSSRRAVGSPGGLARELDLRRARTACAAAATTSSAASIYCATGDRGTSGAIDVGDCGTDAALLLEGWSVRHPCGAAVCREVEGARRWSCPSGSARDASSPCVAAGTGTLTVTVNGVPVRQTAAHRRVSGRASSASPARASTAG